MEQEFEKSLVNSHMMNSMLGTYETNLTESFGDGRRGSRKRVNTFVTDMDDHYMIFDAVQNAETRTQLDTLPSKMTNPFTVMRKWLKFELLDLKAILEAIEKKNEMDKRRIEAQKKQAQNKTELQSMKEGKDSVKTLFMGKNSKINRITALTKKILDSDRDIECLALVHKIIVLQLN